MLFRSFAFVFVFAFVVFVQSCSIVQRGASRIGMLASLWPLLGLHMLCLLCTFVFLFGSLLLLFLLFVFVFLFAFVFAFVVFCSIMQHRSTRRLSNRDVSKFVAAAWVAHVVFVVYICFLVWFTLAFVSAF